jgi:hypothetical protein
MRWTTPLCIVVLAVLGGCGVTHYTLPGDLSIIEQRLEQLNGSGVLPVSTSEGFGSMVAVGAHEALICNHQLPNFPSDAHEISVNGETLRVTLKGRGAVDLAEPSGDWALLHSDDGFEHTYQYAADSEVRPGSRIFLVGFWVAEGEAPHTPNEAIRVRQKVVVGTVIKAPDNLLEGTDMLCVSTNHEGVLSSMSGGGAFVWDAEREQFRLVGIYSRYYAYRFRRGGVQVVVRPPAFQATLTHAE